MNSRRLIRVVRMAVGRLIRSCPGVAMALPSRAYSTPDNGSAGWETHIGPEALGEGRRHPEGAWLGPGDRFTVLLAPASHGAPDRHGGAPSLLHLKSFAIVFDGC